MKWLKRVLEPNRNPEYEDKYLRYKLLKNIIKDSKSYETEILNIAKKRKEIDTQYAIPVLMEDINRMDEFIKQQKNEICSSIESVRKDVKANQNSEGRIENQKAKESLLERAKQVEQQFFELEKYANLNFEGFYKILKKHDKFHPEHPIQHYMYETIMAAEWAQGYTQIVVEISELFSVIRGDPKGQKNDDAAQNFIRTTTKYWVTQQDITFVKLFLLEHLPVFRFKSDAFEGDSQLISSTYLDNSTLELYHGRLDKAPGAIALRLRWYGSDENPTKIFVERKTHQDSWTGLESVKERIVIKEKHMVDFLNNKYSLEQALEDEKGQFKSDYDKQEFTRLFTEISSQVTSKRLKPLVRTQYMRTAFQIPYDATVRASMDTNLCMVREGVEFSGEVDRWKRDPSQRISNSDVIRFPHAILEIKLSLKPGMETPQWVSSLLGSGRLHECHKFSKFCYGTAVLNYDMIRSMPYYMHDESLRDALREYQMPDPAFAGGSSSDDEGEDGDEGQSKAVSSGGSVSRGQGDSLKEPLLRKHDQKTQRDLYLEHQGYEKGKLPILFDDKVKRTNLTEPTKIVGNVIVNSTYCQNTGPSQKRFQNVMHRGDQLLDRIANKLYQNFSTNIDPEEQMRIEPKTHFANERTYLSWLTIAITLGSISSLMVSVAGNFQEDKFSSQFIALYAMLIMFLAIMMASYGLRLFFSRNEVIRQMRPGGNQERIGPMFMGCVTLVTVLLLIILSIYHLVLDFKNNLV